MSGHVVRMHLSHSFFTPDDLDLCLGRLEIEYLTMVACLSIVVCMCVCVCVSVFGSNCWGKLSVLLWRSYFQHSYWIPIVGVILSKDSGITFQRACVCVYMCVCGYVCRRRINEHVP